MDGAWSTSSAPLPGASASKTVLLSPPCYCRADSNSPAQQRSLFAQALRFLFPGNLAASSSLSFVLLSHVGSSQTAAESIRTLSEHWKLVWLRSSLLDTSWLITPIIPAGGSPGVRSALQKLQIFQSTSRRALMSVASLWLEFSCCPKHQ